MRKLDIPHDPDRIEALKEKAQKYLFPWMKLETTIARQDGFYLKQPDGNRILDCHGQILSHVFGKHENNVHESAGIGLDILSPHFGHAIIYQAVVQLGEELEAAGMRNPKIIFQSSGTRANQNAMRIGKGVLGDNMEVMSLRNGYSGAGSNVSLTDEIWAGGSDIGLGVPIHQLPFVSEPENQESEDRGRDYRPALAEALRKISGGGYLLAEAGVMGVAGFRNINPEALQEMAVMVHENGGIVHWDTVQTAPRRANANHLLWVEGLVDPSKPLSIPDIITGAKGLGGGKAFAYMAFEGELVQRMVAGGIGLEYDTYGIALPGAEACLRILDTVNDEEFVKRLLEIEDELRQGLLQVVENHSDVLDLVTGQGLMQGLLFKNPKVVEKAKEIGRDKTNITFGTGGGGRVIRLATKLDSPTEIVTEICSLLDDTIDLAKVA